MQRNFLTLGKYKALQRCSSEQGIFSIVAIDHQDALRRTLNPQNPERVTDAEMTQFKLDVVRPITPTCTGVLLDPLFGAPQAIEEGALGQVGLLVELEKADYQMEPLPLEVEIDSDWSVSKIKRMGADGVKLFFYFNPYATEHAKVQMAIVERIHSECQRYDIPFYAEPIYYSIEEQEQKSHTMTEIARQVKADVLKLEFPVDVNYENDKGVWLAACEQITAAADAPWVLLSAGVTFEMFCRQLDVACKAGASGFIVGRALWSDAAKIDNLDERNDWLRTVGVNRLSLLRSIAELNGQSWHEYYQAEQVDATWFRRYGHE